MGHEKSLKVNSFKYCPPVGFPSWKILSRKSSLFSRQGYKQFWVTNTHHPVKRSISPCSSAYTHHTVIRPRSDTLAQGIRFKACTWVFLLIIAGEGSRSGSPQSSRPQSKVCEIVSPCLSWDELLGRWKTLEICHQVEMWPASNADGIWVAVHQWRLPAFLGGYQGNGSWHSARTIFTNVTFTLLYINPSLFTSSKIKLLCKQPRSICCTGKNTLAWKYSSIR